MTKYLVTFTYSIEGRRNFIKERATRREEAIRAAYASAGGKIEALYWAIGGEFDGVAIAEFPDVASFGAISTTMMASGALSEAHTVDLLTTTEMDAALGKLVSYRPPAG
jgi:uncharacterized protein with GYD domain